MNSRIKGHNVSFSPEETFSRWGKISTKTPQNDTKTKVN